ncbi:MAG: hypothetical protein ACI8RZ_007475 [Myxococcota bacterium]|jgi:hypothetical protein
MMGQMRSDPLSSPMLLLLFGCQSVPVPAPADDVSRAVIVVLDGARVDETMWATDASLADPDDLLPELRALVEREGVRLTGALNTGIPITTESHTELLTGRRQPLGTFPPGQLGAWRSDTPTLFESLQGSRDLATEQLAVLVNTVLIEESMSSRYPGASQHARPQYSLLAADGVLMEDAAVLDQVQVYLDQNDTHLLLTNLHQIDLIAHEGGDYPEAIADVDGALVGLWDFIQSTPPYAENTWLIILADHGRHRSESWDNHGDQCNGCRQIPMMVLGPGLTAGDDDTPVTLSDLSVTLAGLLETDLPHATGQPIQSLLPRAAPTGPRQLTASGDRLAWADRGIWQDRQHADPTAQHAEAPVLSGNLLCWRELQVTIDPEGASEWAARCEVEEDGIWHPLPLRSPVGSAFWQPALAVDDRGRHWLLDTTGQDGATGAAGVRPRLSVWDGVAWQTTLGPELSYPLHPDFLLQGGSALVAVGYSADESDGRDTRQIGVWTVQDDDWQAHPPLTAPGIARLEHPALFNDGTGAQLAAVAWLEGGGVRIATTGQDADGFAPLTLLGSDQVYPHLPPMWTRQGVLVWAERLEDGRVSICRDGVCTPTNHTTIDSLALDGEQVWMSALVADAWQILPAP